MAENPGSLNAFNDHNLNIPDLKPLNSKKVNHRVSKLDFTSKSHIVGLPYEITRAAFVIKRAES